MIAVFSSTIGLRDSYSNIYLLHYRYIMVCVHYLPVSIIQDILLAIDMYTFNSNHLQFRLLFCFYATTSN